MQIIVRFAETKTDRDAIYRLRSDVFVREFGRGDRADAEGRLTDELDDTARLLLAEHDGEVVGTNRLNWGGDAPFSAEDRTIYRLDELEAVIPADQIIIFSRFATRAPHRGTDTPGQLIDAMVRFAIAQGVSVILCDSQPAMVNTYLRLGMRVLGPLGNVPAYGIVVPLILLLDDPAHVTETGSRIASLLHGLVIDGARRDALLALLPGQTAVQTLERPQEAPGWTRIVDVLAQTSPERFPVFQGLPRTEIARLTTMANILSCNAGDLIVRQGTGDQTVFVVLEGAVLVQRDGRTIARLMPGSVFGEVAFLAQVPRTADIVTACDSRLICLRPSTLSALIDSKSQYLQQFLLNLSRLLAVRIANTAPLLGEAAFI